MFGPSRDIDPVIALEQSVAPTEHHPYREHTIILLVNPAAWNRMLRMVQTLYHLFTVPNAGLRSSALVWLRVRVRCFKGSSGTRLRAATLDRRA